MATLRLNLFGLPRIERDGVLLTIERRKVLALLSVLALSPDPLSRDFLAELFWPERNAPTARTDLRATLHALRSAIGQDWVEADNDRVVLRREPGLSVDVLCYHDLLAQAATHTHATGQSCAPCTAALSEAVGLYRGDFLAGFTLRDAPEFDNWQSYQTESLKLALAGALERLAGLAAASGDYEAALRHGRRWLELDPLCEEPHRALMRLHAQAGNRASALRQYEECEHVLAAELGVRPDEETVALRDAVAGGEVKAHPALPVRQPALMLPADRTPFIGREEELAQIARLLANPGCRLLTILGPGGSGKTRLSVAAARRQAGQNADGIYFVDLQPVEEAELLAPAILQALMIPLVGSTDPGDQLVEALSERETLLVLDNFEHLMAGAELLSRLLDRAPGVKLLVTSRARLNLVEEWLLPLGGMALPPEARTQDVLGDFGATALFLASAARLRPGYRPAPREAAEIIRLCRLLDGMPLAIELAAARTRTLPVSEIAAELARGLDVLATTMRDAPTRHRSMSATFDASWRLLSPHERHVMRCASVFRGGFTTEAAGSVTGATAADLEGLADSCWLRVEPGGRWGMHELIRQYCEKKLKTEQEEETGENEGAVKARHVAYFRWFITEKHTAFQVKPGALPQIEPELGNLIAAWQGLSDPADLVQMRKVTAAIGLMAFPFVWWPVLLPLVEHNIRQFRAALVRGGVLGNRRRLELALAWHLILLTDAKEQTGRLADAMADLDEAEALLGSGESDDLDWAQTHYMIVRKRAGLDDGYGRYVAAARGYRATLEQLNTARVPIWIFPADCSLYPRTEALIGLAFVYLHAGQYDEALYWARQAVQTAEKLGSTLGMIFAECVLMYSLIPLGRYLEAKRISRKALPTAKDLHITETVGQFMTLLALTYREENQPEAARIWARRCAMLCQESGYIQLVLPFMLAVWAWAELAIGRPVEARQLCLRSLALIEQSGGKRVGEYASVAVVMGHITLAEGKRDSTADWVRRALASPAKTADATTKAVLLAAENLSSQSRAEPAAELLAFVAHSPLAWHATRRKAEAALRELESELPPDIYTAAVARGQRRELDALVAEVLAYDR